MSSPPRVHVVGTGCLCGAGENVQAALQSLFDGQRHVAPPVRISSSHPVDYPVFEITPSLVAGLLRLNEGISLTSSMALAAAGEALEDGRLGKSSLSSLRVGVCVGTTVGSALNNEEFYRQYKQGTVTDLSQIHRFLHSNPAFVLAEHYQLNGPCQTVVNACSSGTDAIGIGGEWIRSGLCDVVIAGGTDELCRVTYNGFISLMITSSEPCAPFDRNRKGLNLGEGAGMVILASEKNVQERSLPSKARLCGYGTACDGYHLTAPHPEGRGLRAAMKTALEQSTTDSRDIAFINAHGTGTRDNDLVESRVMRDMLPNVPFFSTKGYTGHTLGAAGGVEAVFTIECLLAGRIPKNAGFSTQDPELALSPVKTPMRIDKTVALSQSLAFGGYNSVLVFSAHQ